MRVLVCGGRHFADKDLMAEVLFQNFYAGDILIHGDARGADRMSRDYVRSTYGDACQYGTKIEAYPADWNTHGKAAGPIRNKQMLTEGKPDLVIAFLAPNSRGTKNMIEQATKAGVPVKVINIDETSIKP